MVLRRSVRIRRRVLCAGAACACLLGHSFSARAQSTAENISQDQAILEQSRKQGDQLSEADALNSLGSLYELTGKMKQALAMLGQAVPIYRAVHNQIGEANALAMTARVTNELGRPQPALELLKQALSIDRAVHDRSAEARTLTLMGEVYNGISDLPNATEALNQALSIERDVGDRKG